MVQLPKIHDLIENFIGTTVGGNREIYGLSVNGHVMHFQDTFYHEKWLQHDNIPRVGNCQYKYELIEGCISKQS